MADEDSQYWFNTETKQVEQGRRSHYKHRMGPYPTEAEAAKALDTAAARNEKWDDDDEEWEKN